MTLTIYWCIKSFDCILLLDKNVGVDRVVFVAASNTMCHINLAELLHKNFSYVFAIDPYVACDDHFMISQDTSSIVLCHLLAKVIQWYGISKYTSKSLLLQGQN